MRTLEVALLIQYCYRENDLEILNLPIFVTYAFLHFTHHWYSTTEVMLVFLSKMLLLDVLNGDKTEISYQSNYYAGKAELWNIWGGGK